MQNQIDYHSLRDKKVLITGGLGFIGSSIAQVCVRHGAKVTVLDACIEPYGYNLANLAGIERDVEVVKGDVRDRSLMKQLVPQRDIIFHMAAQVGREISMDSPELDVDINCNGTINVLEANRGGSAKVIFAASRGQIGEPVYLPVDEQHPQNPTDVYGINKLAGEKYLFLYSHVYGFPVVSLRLNNVYGPRCQMHAGFYGILNWFMANAMDGKPITVYGTGQQTRDYVYIDDVVDAFVRSAISDHANNETFFVGSGVETVFVDMVKEILRAVGKGEITYVPFPASREKIDIKRFVVTCAKIEQALGWRAQVPLARGIDTTAAYYAQHLAAYRR
jgi:nucleoside-diphosphate-sugar epimerase